MSVLKNDEKGSCAWAIDALLLMTAATVATATTKRTCIITTPLISIDQYAGVDSGLFAGAVGASFMSQGDDGLQIFGI